MCFVGGNRYADPVGGHELLSLPLPVKAVQPTELGVVALDIVDTYVCDEHSRRITRAGYHG